MIRTLYTKDHVLWDKIVRKENEAKRRWEYLTGDTSAKKFYNGVLESRVDERLETYDKAFMKEMGFKHPDDKKESPGKQ